MDIVKIGVIGYGNMGTTHAKNIADGLTPELTLVAVADLKESRRDAAREALPADVAIFESGEELIESGLCEAVIIATPHYEHPTLAMSAFRHGQHVMCEKPAGVYTKQVREMNAAAAKSGLVFGMMFNQRTNCVYRKMYELVHSGAYGEIKRVNWIVTDWYRSQAYYNSGGWRATWAGEGGGVLLNQCPHNLDLLQWICGMPCKLRAVCHEGKWHDIEVEDDVTAYLEYPNGATGVFVTSTGDLPGTNRFEITMDRAKLICDNGELSLYELEEGERSVCFTTTEGFYKGKGAWVPVETDGENPQHVGVLNAFAARILHGTPLIAEGAEGINGLTLSNAMHLSSWLDREIELPLDEELFFEKLNEKRANSRIKENVTEVTFSTQKSYGK